MSLVVIELCVRLASQTNLHGQWPAPSLTTRNIAQQGLPLIWSVTVVLPKLSLPKRKVGCLVSRLACLALAGALQASMHGETGARCGGGRPPAGVRVRVSRAPSPVGLVAINHRAAEPEDGEAEEIRDGVTWRSRPGAVSCVPN
jgi:hypothetical protein